VAAKLRLRFDKVATGLIERLRAAAAGTVPDGTTVLLTVTAPIRLDSKTGAALEEDIQALARRKSPGRDREETIHGNRVRLRLVRTGSARTPKLLGFVHNPDTDAELLLNVASELLAFFSSTESEPAKARASERPLVVMSARESSCVEAYRATFAQLDVPRAIGSVAIAVGDGRTEGLR
jgi:hypothetical protein